MHFGMLLFTLGLFKKVVIADRLGLYVDAVCNDEHAFTGLLWIVGRKARCIYPYWDTRSTRGKI